MTRSGTIQLQLTEMEAEAVSWALHKFDNPERHVKAVRERLEKILNERVVGDLE